MTIEQLKPCYDAVVIGARCAGAATGMLLARRGLNVLIVDRSPRGSDTLSTHALMRGGVQQLHRWGLIDQVIEAGTPAVRKVTFHYGDDILPVPIKPRDGVDALYAPRRTVLDPILVDAAQRAGADLLFGPRLLDVIRSRSGRVSGVVLQDREGRITLVRAGIVIGADGLRSTVARLVSADVYRRGRHAAGVIYGYWSGLSVVPGQYHWHYAPGVAAGVIPTNDATLVFASVPAERFMREMKGDLAGGYRQVLGEVSPPLARDVSRAVILSPLRGYPGDEGRFRRSWGLGWALVGDAGYFKDPITAHGITDALRDAELLANGITAGSERGLAEYEATRDALSSHLFDVTDEIAGFEWTMDSVRELHRSLNDGMKAEVSYLRALDRHAEAAGVAEDALVSTRP